MLTANAARMEAINAHRDYWEALDAIERDIKAKVKQGRFYLEVHIDGAEKGHVIKTVLKRNGYKITCENSFCSDVNFTIRWD